MNTEPKLKDLLRPGLRLVICGTAAGTRSAAVNAYYAGLTNRFWPILAKTGLTPRLFKPEECRSLLDCGIGLTDLVKGEAGPDSSLSSHGWDVDGLKQRLRDNMPKVVSFNGKRAAKEFSGVRDVAYGVQAACPDLPGITFFVAPSTSGAAGKFWDPGHWIQLAALIDRIESGQ